MGFDRIPCLGLRRRVRSSSMSNAARRVIDVHWFLPTTGDGRSVVDFFPDPAAAVRAGARADIGYLRQIAQAADRLGFAGVLTPTGLAVRGRLARSARRWRAETERLKFIVAFRPGFVLPTLAAQMAATLQRITQRARAAQHRHRRRPDGAARLRRLPGPRRALRAHGRVPRCAAPVLGRGSRSTTRASTTACEKGGLRTPFGRSTTPAPPCRRSTSAARRPRRRRWRRGTLTCTCSGASRRSGWRSAWRACAGWRRSRAARCASASGCTSSRASARRTPGPRPSACCAR